MANKLVIVESPTKAKTISRFLGKDYIVLSSYGHVRDLPKSDMGVDIEHGFTPRYVIPKRSQKNVTALKKALAKTETIILATDEDREGEAIAWHLTQALGLNGKSLRQSRESSTPVSPRVLGGAGTRSGQVVNGKSNDDKRLAISDKPIKRIVFHEITDDAIQEALKNPRIIDMKLVDAQQARRILDRLVGYELSPLLWKKVARGLSAGRVQSVAVRFIAEREREIKAFEKKEYWTIEALFEGKKQGVSHSFPAKLHTAQGKQLEKFSLTTQDAAKKIVSDLEGASYRVHALTQKTVRRNPPPPFTTSTLQQEANMKLGFSAKQTMMLAQQLYEGIELGEEGSTGLITYMRTDSVNLSKKFVEEAAIYIQKHVGQQYAIAAPRTFTTKSKLAQEAHEAIRPTSAMRTPETVHGFLAPNQALLYDLVWRRALASQMKEAELQATTLDIATEDTAKHPYTFRATGSVVVFDGFLRILGTDIKTTLLPPLANNDPVACTTLEPKQHFTEPPPRYSDATLVKTLEEHGIGRPSTYAPTIATIIERNYVERIEGRRLKPTDIGLLVNDLLVEHFPQIVDYQFTATMEDALDAIAEGTKDWQPIIATFYHPFKKNLEEKEKTLVKKELTEEATNEVCDKCGKPMVIKLGRFGRFLACTGFPECRNTKPLAQNGESRELVALTTDETCSECKAPMVVKQGRFGNFLACSRYPECKNRKSIEVKTGVACPACTKGDIVVKRSKRGRSFYSCNQYPDCTFALWSRPTGERCPTCQSLLVLGVKNTVRCSKKGCPYKKVTHENTNVYETTNS